MPSAGAFDFTLDQGTSFELPVRVPFDLTDYTARMQLRKKVGMPVLLDLTTENQGIEITAGVAESVVTVKVRPDQSSAITERRAVYDLELYGPDNGLPVIRLIKGAVTIDPEVTRG